MGTHLSSSWQRSTDTCIGQALSAQLQAENAGNCVIWSLKFQTFSGEHAPGPPSGLGLRPRVTVSWSHSHIALQTTLSTPWLSPCSACLFVGGQFFFTGARSRHHSHFSQTDIYTVDSTVGRHFVWEEVRNWRQSQGLESVCLPICTTAFMV